MFWFRKKKTGLLEQIKELSITSSFLEIPGLIFFKDTNSTYIGANQNFLSVAGLNSLSELIGKTDQELPWEKQSSIIRKNDLSVLQTGQFLQVEEMLSTPNNVKIFITVRRPLKNKNGEILGLIANSIDITSIKTFEHQLQLDKNKIEDEKNIATSYLNNIVLCTPGHLYWKDLEGRYLGANDFFLQVTGLKSLDELLGKTDRDLPWGAQYEALKKNDLYVMQTGKTINVEETAILADHTQRTFMAAKMPLRDIDGNIIGIVGNSLDITQQKEAEEALKTAKNQAEIASQAKTEFLQNMRHDLRTPLSGIVGFSELIRHTKDPHKIEEYAAGLAESSGELLNFIDEILESIHISSGQIPLLKKKFSLKTTLEKVIKLHYAKAMTKQLELFFYFDSALPEHLIGDPGRIYRIVLELLSNSLKFTEKGHVAIAAKLSKKNERDLIVMIEIEDTGPGIPENKQQILFEQFNRLTPSYQGIYKGTGMGFYIVKQFLDDLQGEIYIESRVNQGSKFTCCFPLKEALLDNSFGEDPISGEGGNAFSKGSSLSADKVVPVRNPDLKSDVPQKYSILIVEDDSFAAIVEETILKYFSYDIDLASDGNTAIQKFNQKKYDLVLMDIGLPDMDGYQVTTKCRQYEKDMHPSGHYVPVPILGFTAHGDEKIKQKGVEVGMNAVFTKPLTYELASDILRNFL